MPSLERRPSWQRDRVGAGECQISLTKFISSLPSLEWLVYIGQTKLDKTRQKMTNKDKTRQQKDKNRQNKTNTNKKKRFQSKTITALCKADEKRQLLSFVGTYKHPRQQQQQEPGAAAKTVNHYYCRLYYSCYTDSCINSNVEVVVAVVGHQVLEVEDLEADVLRLDSAFKASDRTHLWSCVPVAPR